MFVLAVSILVSVQYSSIKRQFLYDVLVKENSQWSHKMYI